MCVQDHRFVVQEGNVPVSASTIINRVLLAFLAAALLALSGTMAWAAANDFQAREYVADGVTVAGADLSGMTEAQARTAIERSVSAPLLREVEVSADGQQFIFDPRGAVTVDVDGMLDEAFEARRSASYVERLKHDLTGEPLTVDIEPAFAVDDTVLQAWLDGVKEAIDRKAVNAKVKIVDSKVKLIAEKPGAKTQVAEAAQALRAAFHGEAALEADKRVTLPVKVLKPKVTEKNIGKTIVVDLSQRRIRLYDGGELEKTYRCAIGTPSYPTPTGKFEIVQKRYMPTWVNPAPNGWGKDMPPSIPPGYSNPLGTRALNLSAPGIRFHGTTNIGSVGTAASHGCMRMRMPDIEDFFPRVKVGTPVYIVP